MAMSAKSALSRPCGRAALDAARALFEGGDTPVAEIARRVQLSATSVARYAKVEGWRRPSSALTPPVDPAARLTDRLWAALEQRIALVEKDPGATPARDYVALSHALRDLIALAGARAAAAPGQSVEPGEECDAEALRAELLARLERILAS